MWAANHKQIFYYNIGGGELVESVPEGIDKGGVRYEENSAVFGIY